MEQQKQILEVCKNGTNNTNNDPKPKVKKIVKKVKKSLIIFEEDNEV